jgi:hypothetical protein
MTAQEFDTKWDKYIPNGWYGLAVDHEKLINYLDKEFDCFLGSV